MAAEERPAYLLDLRELAFIMRSNNMMLFYNPARGAFVNAFENLTYDEVVAQGLYDFGWGRRLEPDEVQLPRKARDFPKYAQKSPEAPGYGFGDEWRANLRVRDVLPPELSGTTDNAAIKQSSSLEFCAPSDPTEPEAQAARVLDLKRSIEDSRLAITTSSPGPANVTPSAG